MGAIDNGTQTILWKYKQAIDSSEINTLFRCKSLSQTEIKKIIKDNPEKFAYFNIPNRQDAFNLAVKLAESKDTVIAMGKGHETTILHGHTEYPWSETEAFRLAFSLKKKK